MEDKLAALEEKFAVLKYQYEELSKKVSASDNTSDDESSVIGDGKNEDDNFVPISRARILHNVVDEKTDGRKDVLPDGTQLSPKALQNTKPYAFTLRKFINFRFRDVIEIHDNALRDLLRSQLRHYPGHILVNEPVTFATPFEPIVFNWDKLEKLANSVLLSAPDDQSHSDLRLLLKTVSENSGEPRLDQYFKSRAQNIEQKRVSFESLWTIFPPGEKVFGRAFQKQDQLFVVQEHANVWPARESARGKSKPWYFQCWTYDWNGHNFLRSLLNLKIERFEGTKLINSLPFYPLCYHDNPKQVEEALEERGRLFRKLCIAKKGEQMFHYKGQAILGKKGIDTYDSYDEYSSDSDDEYSQFASNRHNTLITGPKSSQVESTVMVDYVSFSRYGPAVPLMGAWAPIDENPDCNCSECRNNDELTRLDRRNYDKATGEERESDWVPEQFVLCPPRVLGYVLRDKRWAQLQVNLVKKDLNDNKDAYFKKLQLVGKDSGRATKDLLMSLVKNHGGGSEEKDDDQVDDIVANKGKGLVVLLYGNTSYFLSVVADNEAIQSLTISETARMTEMGLQRFLVQIHADNLAGPPGVGKTSTAETVAIAAKKPLFPVSVADVGTKAKYVEANLEKIFDLATTWEAILLIDEADVFLESRSKGAGNNTERNALVSVFLRVLEYYQGILFLTTNQIAQFDVAVQSRIHIALKYEPLNEAQTSAIFMQFLSQLQDKNKVRSMSKIEEWLESDLLRRKASFDGRQIRNIVSCAMSLARAEDRPLEKDDLLKVVDIVRDFKTEFQLQFDRYLRSQEGRSADKF